MFENKDKQLEALRRTLEEFAEHMCIVSDGMSSFKKDLGLFARELNLLKSYMEVLIDTLSERGVISIEETKDKALRITSEKVREIQKNLKDYERKISNENHDMKVLVEKFKSSISNWFDEDGNPIAKA
tara:strand:- start:27 stop:410 length:384 start_codon:yes stop_codon:yes gene_type:complete